MDRTGDGDTALMEKRGRSRSDSLKTEIETCVLRVFDLVVVFGVLFVGGLRVLVVKLHKREEQAGQEEEQQQVSQQQPDACPHIPLVRLELAVLEVDVAAAQRDAGLAGLQATLPARVVLGALELHAYTHTHAHTHTPHTW